MTLKKLTCVFSEPVQIALDELMTEVIRRLPEEEVAAALRMAAVSALKRSKKSRHNRYKIERLFRKASERLVNIPEELALVVGLKTPDPQLSLPLLPPAPSLVVEPIVDEETRRMEAFLSDVPPDPLDTTFNFDLPTFDTFKHVFGTYPYACLYKDEREGLLLVLGYASGRSAEGRLLRRNCVLVRPDGTEQNFNDLVSVYGTFSKKKGPIHQTIKVIPLPLGAGIRFWTNVAGIGDMLDKNRFLVVLATSFEPSDAGLHLCNTYVDMRTLMAQIRRPKPKSVEALQAPLG